jgi:hypothetical protein
MSSFFCLKLFVVDCIPVKFLGFALNVNITIILTEPIYENRTSTMTGSTMTESKCNLFNTYKGHNIHNGSGRKSYLIATNN